MRSPKFFVVVSSAFTVRAWKPISKFVYGESSLILYDRLVKLNI